MPLTFPAPRPDGAARRALSQKQRLLATTVAGARPVVPTTLNGEEAATEGTWPFQFTKGLPHDTDGFVAAVAYELFVDAINADAPLNVVAPFDVPLGPLNAVGNKRPDGFAETTDITEFLCPDAGGTLPSVRNWESPRSGHVTDLEGADAGDLAMPPAPSVGTDELTAEMAEVYALALLRDVPFSDIRAGDSAKAPAGASTADVLAALKTLPWFDLKTAPTGIFNGTEALSVAEIKRRRARLNGAGDLDAQSLFRGSAPGAKDGPYISQFMLAGTVGDPQNGEFDYGAQTISHRVSTFPAEIDYMTDWNSWLDVQNGADLAMLQGHVGPRRFITTPRDLASYVRIDQLYQAYLNAGLMLLSLRGNSFGFDPGMPTGPKGTRGSFATFGPPHLLALLTEVSSRGLKAVRRQKFNHHRRSRPERIGAMLTHVANKRMDRFDAKTRQNLIRMYGDLHNAGLLGWIAAHNARQMTHPVLPALPGLPLQNRGNQAEDDTSLLLPMAFIEGSPMHAAYGAGHATVAGACVTILKAFFGLFKTSTGWDRKTLSDIGMTTVFQADPDSNALMDSGDTPGSLTVEGELNKLAANVSIGRNMAGVHYYSDYYDSIRLGERIAVTILEEQMVTYPDPWHLRLTGFDDERITIRSTPTASGLVPEVIIEGQDYHEWLAVGAHEEARGGV